MATIRGHPKHELHDFFLRTTREMSWEYERVRRQTSQNSELSGDQIEESWASIISNWLPPNYEVVTKSAIINERGEVSDQMDILVLKPIYPKEMRRVKPHLSVGVAAAFECKLTLRNRDIEKQFEIFSKAKKLYKPKLGTPISELRSPLICGLLSHSTKKRDNLDNIIQQSLLQSSKLRSHPRDLMDILCIADYKNYFLYESTYVPANSPEQKALFPPELYRGESGVFTGYLSPNDLDEMPHYSSIGGFIYELTRRLAWQDQTLRDLANFYRTINMRGSSHGYTQWWPMSVYSDEVAKALPMKVFQGHSIWDEWIGTTF